MKKMGLVLLLALWCLFSCTAMAAGAYTPGDPVKDFTATLSDGTTFTLSEALAEKKAVLLNFWASWCGPCMSEMPAMEEAWQQLQDDVAFVCLSIEPSDTAETIASLRDELGLDTLPMGIDDSGLYSRFDNPEEGIPFTVVIDRNGVLCFSHCGAVTDAAVFVNLMNVFTDADYAESQTLTEMPKLLPTVAASSEEEMRSVLGAQGMELLLAEDEAVWPFVAGADGVYASNTKAANTQASFSVKLTAEAGEGVAFSCMSENAPGLTVFSVSVDGALHDVLNGCSTWTDKAVVFESAGEHVVTFTFEYRSAVNWKEMSAGLRSIRKVSAAEAEAIRAALPQSVNTLEGREIAFEAVVGEFRDASVYCGEELYYDTQVLLSESPVTLRIRIGEEIDPHYAFVETCEDIMMLDSLPQDALGYLLTLNADTPEICSPGYAALYDDVTNPLLEMTHMGAFTFYTPESLDLLIADFNEYVELYFGGIDDQSRYAWAYAGDPIPSGTATYTVTVTDQAGNAVAGVMVQFCTAESCQVVFTDASGAATLTGDPYPYEVHITKATGYEKPDQTWVMPENGGNLNIVLTAQ